MKLQIFFNKHIVTNVIYTLMLLIIQHLYLNYITVILVYHTITLNKVLYVPHRVIKYLISYKENNYYKK